MTDHVAPPDEAREPTSEERWAALREDAFLNDAPWTSIERHRRDIERTIRDEGHGPLHPDHIEASDALGRTPKRNTNYSIVNDDEGDEAP